MSEQPQRPTSNDDLEAWKEYWARTQPEAWFNAWGYWRTEPEIGEERQRFLAERRAVKPDIEKGIYAFKGVRLNRADIEWLLATHENAGVIGPVDWTDAKQRAREGLDVRGADLQAMALDALPLARLRAGLARQDWDNATMEQREASRVHLEGANLADAHLEGAYLDGAYMLRSTLFRAHLEQAILGSAHLEQALLHGAHLQGARIRGTYFDAGTNLGHIQIYDENYGPAFIGEVRWQGVNVAAVDWSQLSILSEERVALQRKSPDGKRKSSHQRVDGFEEAVRAYRQLTIVLRSQGLNEHADRFAYRANVVQRQVLRLQGRFLRYLGSLLLGLVAGYGYRPVRSVITYVLVTIGFAVAYFSVTNFTLVPFLPTHSTRLAWYEALVLSVSSFHGRGFFPSTLALGDPLAILAAFEAIIGLLIEITFIATFTQRFFAR